MRVGLIKGRDVMKITETIDNRIEQLTQLRKYYIGKGDIQFAKEMWSRIEELIRLKRQFIDKEENWLI
jgi:tRNA uridine 5-carbamoylmethylation protein Kti12